MILEGYTAEVFVENFKKDMEVFGDDTQAIYEEIFSTIIGRKVKLDGFVKELNSGVLEETPADDRMIIDYARTMGSQHAMSKAAEGINGALFSGNVPDSVKQQVGAMVKAKTFDAAKLGGEQAAQQAAANLANAGKVVNGPGLLSRLGGWLSQLPGKVKTFFGGLKGKSFSEIMNGGLSWLQANPMLALKTTGGIALIAILIRALKKRNQLKNYPNLYRIANSSQSLREDCYDTVLGDTKEKEAMRKVLEECQTNKALNELMFGEIKERKADKFNY